MARQVPINKLHEAALRALDKGTEPEELRKNNLTETYYKAKQKILEEGGLLNIQFRGLPGSGKSTAMIAEVYHTNQLLNKHTTVHHILQNQIVYMQIIRRVKTPQHLCLGIDEYDETGNTGYNATVDQANMNSFSDLARAFYLHRYSCSPKDTIDKNAYILLDVLGADKEQQYTRCTISYKILIPGSGIEHEQLIGYIDIDVSGLLNTPFYKEYHQRKMDRLQLSGKYGIQNEKHIFFAKLLLHAYNELKDIARYSKIERQMIKLQIDMSSRELKQYNSILASNEFTDNLQSILLYLTMQEKERTIIKKLKHARDSGNLQVIPQIALHIQTLERLHKQHQKILTYWHQAQTLEHLYLSNLFTKTKR